MNILNGLTLHVNVEYLILACLIVMKMKPNMSLNNIVISLSKYKQEFVNTTLH